MATADLAGARIKFDRANEHLDALKEGVTSWMKPHTEKGLIHLARDGEWWVMVSEPLSPAPKRLAAIAGDFVQNLRAVLDYLVWQLVLREGEEPTEANAFPICETKNGFIRDVKEPKRRERSALWRIPVDGGAWAIIEGAQPFNRPPGNPAFEPWGPAYHAPLAVLSRLSNADKHRSLLIDLTFPEQRTVLDAFGWSDDVTLVEQRISALPLSYELPTEVMRLRFAPSDRDPGMYMKGSPALNPTFGEEGAKPDRDGFTRGTQLSVNAGTAFLVGAVREVVEQVALLPRVVGWE